MKREGPIKTPGAKLSSLPDAVRGGGGPVKGCERLDLDASVKLLRVVRSYFDDPCNGGIGDNQPILHQLPDGWLARDQGRVRGTCVSFAALAAYELYRYWNNGGAPVEDFSEELLYAQMRTAFDLRKRAKPAPPAGEEPIEGYDDFGASLLWQAGSALDATGAAGEELLPYKWSERRPAYHVPDAAAGIPAGAYKTLDKRVHRVAEMPTPDDRPGDPLSHSVRYLLSHKVPVCLSFPMLAERGGHNVWSFSPGWSTGVIADPKVDPNTDGSQKPDNIGGHSVCIVGYFPDASDDGEPGSGWFVFRNSWGRRFGHSANFGAYPTPVAPQPGYGIISTHHVDTHCWEMMFIAPKK
ncbi:MAG: hypothetical protein AAF092_04655 [Pseudomonadota bacterium]